MTKVVSIVTDNDITMRKACDLLAIKHFLCFAHTINLLVQEVYDDLLDTTEALPFSLLGTPKALYPISAEETDILNEFAELFLAKLPFLIQDLKRSDSNRFQMQNKQLKLWSSRLKLFF